MLLPDGSREDAHAVADDVLAAIRAHPHLEPLRPAAQRSAPASGSRRSTSSELTGEDVLVDADLAMYEAKEGGRDRVASHGAGNDAPTRLADPPDAGRT